MDESTEHPAEPATYTSRHGQFAARVKPLGPGWDPAELARIARIALDALDPENEAEELLRERLERAADTPHGDEQPIDHATARARIEKRIRENRKGAGQ